MKAPIISKNQFVVVKAEYTTGIILKVDGSYFLNVEDEKYVYELFETFDAAKEYAIKEVLSNPKIECFVKNAENKTVFYVDMNGEKLIEKI